MTTTAEATQIVVYNVVQVPEQGREQFEQAFAQRQSKLKGTDGFEGFELLRRDDGSEYLVASRWRDQAAFDSWVSSDAFKHAHKNADPSDRPAEQRPHGAEVRKYEVILSESA